MTWSPKQTSRGLKSEIPEAFGDISKEDERYVLLEREKPYLWVECGFGSSLEELLGEMHEIIEDRNDEQEDCDECTSWSAADFVIGDYVLGTQYAERAKSFIDAFKGYIPDLQECGRHAGLAVLWATVVELPFVVTAFTPSFFGAVAMLPDCGMPTVLLLDDDEG